MSIKSIFSAALVATAMLGTAASAASFFLDDAGGVDDVIEAGMGYSLGAPALPQAIVDFQGAGEFGGLFIDGTAQIKATYIGSEAGASNSFSFGGNGFDNSTSTAGDSFVFDSTLFSGDLQRVAFSFITDNLGGLDSIDNGDGSTTAPGSLHLAFSDIRNVDGATEVYLYFGDGAGDSDFDDLVVKLEILTAVPLPAGGALLLSGIVGAGLMRRRKKTAKKA